MVERKFAKEGGSYAVVMRSFSSARAENVSLQNKV
jgi:hypothetical protein